MRVFVFALAAIAFYPAPRFSQAVPPPAAQPPRATVPAATAPANPVPIIWRDPGELTPAKVYWGIASAFPDPTARRPAPPFTNVKPDDRLGTTSPKAKAKDAKKVQWTIKFNPKVDSEVHAEIAATRLAWALGLGEDEDYYVGSGKFDGFSGLPKKAKAAPYIQPDGSFQETRFKRHREEAPYIKDASGDDRIWDEKQNPGVPPEHLSGLLIFDVLVHNWDAQPKNCKILHVAGPKGPEDWYIMSDMGASFGGGKNKGNLQTYQAEKPYIKKVANGFVEMTFNDALRSEAAIHEKIPLAHAQWFRKRLVKLTDDEIRAAFNAAYATDELDKAYLSGDMAQVNKLTSPTAAGFAAKVRERIEEFKSKVPE